MFTATLTPPQRFRLPTPATPTSATKATSSRPSPTRQKPRRVTSPRRCTEPLPGGPAGTAVPVQFSSVGWDGRDLRLEGGRWDGRVAAALCEGHRALVLGRRRGLVPVVELSSPPLGSRARCAVGDSQLLSAAPGRVGVRGRPRRGRAPALAVVPWGKQRGGCVVCTPPWLWPGCALVTAALARPGTGAFPAPPAATPQVPALAAVAQPGGPAPACRRLPVPSSLGCCWVSLMPKPCLLLTINSRAVPSHRTALELPVLG